MRVLVFSDLHLHRWSDFASPTEDGGNTRLQDGLSVFRKVGDLAIKEDAHLIVFNGDLFHRRGVIDTFVFNRAFVEVVKLAERVGQYGVDIVLLAGNHDQGSRVAGYASTAIYAFSSIPHVKVYLSPSYDDVQRLGFIPYTEDPEEVSAAFKSMRKSRVIFFHGGINGAATGPLEYRPKEEVTIGDLPSKPLILCGHYHQRQKLRDNIWYVGSPMQHVRGEGGDIDKGCALVDTATKKLRWFDFEYPRFVKTIYPDTANVVGNFVDVTFNPHKVDALDVLEYYRKHEVAHALLSPVVSVNDKSSRKRIDVTDALDYEALMQSYVQKFCGKLKPHKLMDLGRELLGRTNE